MVRGERILYIFGEKIVVVKQVTHFLYKLGKVVCHGVLVVFGLLVVAMVALYVPGVQDFARERAERSLSESTGMDISVGKVLLRFPLDLLMEDVYVGVGEQDTLLALGKVKVDVALNGVLHGVIGIRELGLEGMTVHMADTATGMRMDVVVGEVSLQARSIDLKRQVAEVTSLSLKDGTVYMKPGVAVADGVEGESVPLAWQLKIGRVCLANVDYEMGGEGMTTMRAGVGEAVMDGGRVVLGSQKVEVGSLIIDGGYGELLIVAEARTGDTVADAAAVLPWDVRVGALRLKDGRFYMREKYARVDTLGFPALIDARGIEVEVDSVRNRGMEVEAKVRHVALREGSGLVVRDLTGEVKATGKETEVSRLALVLEHSRLVLDVRAEGGLADFGEMTPIHLRWEGQVAGRDLLPFVVGVDSLTRRVLVENRVATRGEVVGSLADLQLPEIRLEVPGSLLLTAAGEVVSPMEAERVNGNVDLHLLVADGALAEPFLAGSGVALPDSLSVNVSAALAQQVVEANVILMEGEGEIELQGDYHLEEGDYRLEMDARDFALDAFLPSDSVGLVSLVLEADGKGWDWTRDRASVRLDIDTLEYRGYGYDSVSLSVGLDGGKVTGELVSGSAALDVGMSFEGQLLPRDYRLHLVSDVRHVDLQALHFSPAALAFALGVDVEGVWDGKDEVELRMGLRDIFFNDGYAYELGDLTMEAGSDDTRTTLNLDAGDLKVRFEGEGGLIPFMEQVAKAGDVVMEQVERYALDAEVIQEALPAFRLEVSAGEDNLLHRYLAGSGLDFKGMSLAVGNSSSGEMGTDIRLQGLSSSGLGLDSVTVVVFRAGRALRYGANVYASVEQLAKVSEFGVEGNVVDNQLQMRLQEKGGDRDEMINIGFDLLLSEETLRLSIAEAPLVLGYMAWEINKGNYVLLEKGGGITADLRLRHEDQLVQLESGVVDSAEWLDVDIRGINLGRTSEAISFLPTLSGILSLKAHLTQGKEQMSATGTVNVEELAYEQGRIGNVDLSLDYRQQQALAPAVGLDLAVDGQPALRVKGNLPGEGQEDMYLDVDFPAFPLALANAFVPSDMLTLGGFLQGGIDMSGSMAAPSIRGDLQFKEGTLNAPVVGTTFSLDTTRLLFDEHLLHFNHWGIISPNKQRLELVGDIDFTSFSNILVNTTVSAKNFQAIAAEEDSKHALVYGKAFLDVSTSLKGSLDALVIRGDVGLLGNTVINYAMKSSPLEVTDKTDDLVRFVSFRDTLQVEAIDTTERIETTSLDLLMTLNIDPMVNVNVLLSSNGQNRVSINGGGALTYALNPMGDARLTGRYALAGGLISYGLPVVGQKEFTIKEGNYVEWSGELMNPKIDITAVEAISASVTDDSQNSRLVNFDAMIKVGGTLEKMTVDFDLAATGDMTIQNQLAGMTAEERSREAMNLMVYGTYTAPGTVAKNNMSDNAINNLVERELNQWSREHLKGVDLSFGINSYNQMTEDGESKTTDYSYKLSKRFFNDKVRVSIGGSVSTGNNPAEAGGMEESLVDDISIEYMFGQTSKYFLKLFRHTGYESVLEGEVTQTGIGVVLRRSFQKFMDIFQRKKDKSTIDEDTNQ